MRMPQRFKRLTVTFFAVKCMQYLIVFFSPSQFDTSTALFLSEYQLYSDLKWYHKLLSWDSVFFVKNAIQFIDNGNKGLSFWWGRAVPQYEHEWVFSPFSWSSLLGYVGSKEVIGFDLVDNIVLKGSLLNFFIHYVSVWILYALTLQTFPKNSELAYKTALLFILSSAGGFLLAPYSEPLSFILAFLGMLMRGYALCYNVYGHISFKYYGWIPYMLSAVAFSLATASRSNCIILGVYYVYDLFKLLKQRDFIRAFWFPFIAGFMMLMLYCYIHYYLPYYFLCPYQQEWCSLSLPIFSIPYTSFYSFLQGKYWNIGFLNYWSLNNVPNFVLSLPNIVLIWYSTIYFSYQYPLESLRPLVYITRLLLIILTFFAHVQIINRVFTFIPLHLWYLSDRLIKTTGYAKGDDKLVYLYIHWLFFWIPLQTVLFAAFLPPA
ncbi:GPI-anchor transamidase GPI18 Ecym_5301 [Eremothecium cymbalariae DBVPG|uniref:GPI mannosyltransferase 2 n=1 Tax=Eremothecium cymbalariae (strain CBS 270.75 / DBVPG 7215 / KCTC 17166 / NRRL Y-17582) TaxID=931890 RepID=I6NDC1_ERECY|nr:hypothetical protein Ecym_5301 [Eremothecium cymbalariae DBVPG\